VSSDADICIYLLETGSITLPRMYGYGWGGESLITVPTPSFLIRHPNGDVIFEGGMQPEVAVNARGYYDGLLDHQMNFTADDHVRNRVAECEVDPDGVRHVVMSHLHYDHAVAIGHFPNATYHVHRRELEYSRAPDWYAALGYQARDLNRDVAWSLIETTEDAPEFDLFGDGTVRTIFSPGHTRGLMAMLVDVTNAGPVVLPSDVSYARAHYESREFAGFFIDGPAVVRSVERLRRYQYDLGTDLVVFTHDSDQWSKLPKGLPLTAEHILAAQGEDVAGRSR
jgi:N-acyl homoserine lactone hydrolase